MNIKVGVDIDGVVCDLTPSLVDRMNKKYGVTLRTEEITEWNWRFVRLGKDHRPVDIESHAEIKDAFADRDFVQSLPMVQNAQLGVSILRAIADDVVFVTSRSDSTKDATTAWITDNFGIYDVPKVLFSKLNKNGHELDILIDDNLETIINFVADGGYGILFRRPWNQKVQTIKRLEDAKSVTKTGRYTTCNSWADIIRTFVSEYGQPYVKTGIEIGRLLQYKNSAYGDSFAKIPELLKIIYPYDIREEDYENVAIIVRVLDKINRIAANNDPQGETPWMDIAGYAMLMTEKIKREKNDTY